MLQQRTLKSLTRAVGVGLHSGQRVELTFRPAPVDAGIVFRRIDLPVPVEIKVSARAVSDARMASTISAGGDPGAPRVQTVEHLLAAFAGLEIDNCLVQVNAEELPIGDGSADHFVSALLDAGRVDQQAARRVCSIAQIEQITLPDAAGSLDAAPAADGQLHITYDLDYPDTPIGRQSCSMNVVPKSFVGELSFARTFVLEREVARMRAQGFGLRATTANVLVFDRSGPVATSVRAANECARHKALDCLGDFALLGCDLVGRIHARQSGHTHNHELIRRLDHQLRARPRVAAAG